MGFLEGKASCSWLSAFHASSHLSLRVAVRGKQDYCSCWTNEEAEAQRGDVTSLGLCALIPDSQLEEDTEVPPTESTVKMADTRGRVLCLPLTG